GRDARRRGGAVVAQLPRRARVRGAAGDRDHLRRALAAARFQPGRPAARDRGDRDLLADLLAARARDGAPAGAAAVTFAAALAVLAAGFAAGGINPIVGSGSLITFPTLLAVGYPSVTANVSNGLGLTLGNISGAIGYREELRGQRERVMRLAVGSAFGSL